MGLHQLGDSPQYILTLEDRVIELLVEPEAQAFNVRIGGREYVVETGRGAARRREEGDRFVEGKWLLRAPLTGVVQEVRTRPGEAVAPGDVLLVIEAMKMLNELRARVAGRVAAVMAAEGDRVEIGAPLVEVREA